MSSLRYYKTKNFVTYRSPTFIRKVKSGMLLQAARVTSAQETMFVGKLPGKRHLDRPKRGWEVNGTGS